MSGFPIRARVALALVLVVVPAALGFVYFTQRARREAALETVYETALARMEEGGRERCEDRPRRAMRRERRLLATYDAALVSRDPDAPRVPAAVGEAFAAGEVAVLDPRSPRRALLRMPWDEGPCAVLLVELPSPQRGTAVRDVGLMLAVLALSLAAALVALGGPLRRLGALAHAAKAPGGIARLAVPRGTRGADEVGVLSAALDEAATAARAQLAELEAKSRALRGYVDGTTHDLAVPLTVLQGQLAELRAQAGVDPAALEGAISSVTYLGQLAANLATAARLEQGAAPLDRRPVDLGVVVDRVIARLTPIARHRRVELAASLPDEKVFLDGDELLLERALSNLVHNAIRHRPDGPGHVAVIVRAEPTSVIVKGDGAKVDDRTLALLRAGEAPSDASRTRGRGIGLSIVRQVARRHGLALVFERADGGTLEVTLTRAGPGSEPTDANG